MSAPPPAARRRHLVFVRAGASSVHPRLLQEDPARSWDCCVSWYGAGRSERLAEYYATAGDNKFEGFLAFWQATPAAHGYSYYLLLDDDVYFEPGDVSRLLSLCERHGTQLSQPALRWDTFFNMKVHLANPACTLRAVSFVEVMAPCFAAATLKRLLATFLLTRSTWGIDWAWACLSPHGSMYVVDAVRVAHTKLSDPHGGAFYRKLQAMGVDAGAELEAVQRAYGSFGGVRTLPAGHVYRAGVPRPLRRPLLAAFEALKVLARARKQLIRYRFRGRRGESAPSGVHSG